LLENSNSVFHPFQHRALKANKEIARIIRIKKDNLTVFGQHPKFRGPEVFEALLPLGENLTPGRGFDGDLSGSTVGMSNGSYYMEMIDNIDGLSISDYINNVSRRLFTTDERIEIATEDPVKYKLSHFNNATIKAAWESGKIVLKKYGEE